MRPYVREEIDDAFLALDKRSHRTRTEFRAVPRGQHEELGLPISTEMPKEVMELIALYPQPVRAQGGGVEYLPVPRHGVKSNAGPDWCLIHASGYY